MVRVQTVAQEVVAEEVVQQAVELQIKDMQEALVGAVTIPEAEEALGLWAVITLPQKMEPAPLVLAAMV